MRGGCQKENTQHRANLVHMDALKFVTVAHCILVEITQHVQHQPTLNCCILAELHTL